MPPTVLIPPNAHNPVAHQVVAAAIWPHSHTVKIGNPSTSTTTVRITPVTTSNARVNGSRTARMRPRLDHGTHAAMFFTRLSVLSAASLTSAKRWDACVRRLDTVFAAVEAAMSILATVSADT